MENNETNQPINVTISGHHTTVTPALKEEITVMLKKLKHKFDHITNVHVILRVDNSAHLQTQEAEAELHLASRKKPFFAKVATSDMYDSLHKLSDILSRQITKHKEHLQDH